MIDGAQEIFDHLPVRQTEIEARYIRHLWLSFEHLSNSEEEDVRAFAAAPFHLMFMLSLQYKGMRLYKRRGAQYVSHAVIQRLDSKRRKAQTPGSVFDLALMSESHLAEIFSIQGVAAELISSIKSLVVRRNDGFAHAKGAIEEDVERKIEEHLSILRGLSPAFIEINEDVATEWLGDLTSGEGRENFVESRVATEYLCPADFSAGTLHNEFAPALGFESFKQ